MWISLIHFIPSYAQLIMSCKHTQVTSMIKVLIHDLPQELAMDLHVRFSANTIDNHEEG